MGARYAEYLVESHHVDAENLQDYSKILKISNV